MKLAVSIALVLAAAATARASVWEQATTVAPDEESVEAKYDEAMDEGDQATRLVAGQSTSVQKARDLVMTAVRNYEEAAALRPNRAEPHWRAAQVLYTMMLDCPDVQDNTILCDSAVEGDHPDPRIATRVIAHWDEAERLEPLDPRIKGIYFSRAILNTKLATMESLADAKDDYEALLDRGSTLQLRIWSQTTGNLAETYMMLGDLDMAITRYKDAVASSSSTSMLYGLAIAYDRDEQGAKAKEIIAALGEDAAEQWELEVARHLTFYVPDGEEHYYRALIDEALGREKSAVTEWKEFIDSGAHPQYQPRAQHHLDTLKGRILQEAARKATDYGHTW